MSKVKGGGKILNVDGNGGGGFCKLDNFHGCHMCIVPNMYIYFIFYAAASGVTFAHFIF